MSAKTAHAPRNTRMLRRALGDSFIKLAPHIQVRNFVMFTVYLSAIMTTALALAGAWGLMPALANQSAFAWAIAAILWFTVLFANFAEAIAEGRGKAQADSLRKSRKSVDARKLPDPARSTMPL